MHVSKLVAVATAGYRATHSTQNDLFIIVPRHNLNLERQPTIQICACLSAGAATIGEFIVNSAIAGQPGAAKFKRRNFRAMPAGGKRSAGG
jgi:hypothetical protein